MKHRAAVVVVASTLVVIATSCRNEKAAKVDSPAQVVRMTDPHFNEVCGPLPGPGMNGPGSMIPKPAAEWLTIGYPEYHDQQRFVDGNTYGPVVCVVAAQGLENLGTADFTAAGGRIVAYLWVGALDPGEVFSAAYTDLHVDHSGYYCVNLRYASSAWQGWVLPATGGTCATASDATSLDVDGGENASETTPANFPPVARFMLSRNSKHAAIGVRCAVGWCIIGATTANFDPPPHPAIGSAAARVRRKVLGWFDDQGLAVPPTTGTAPHGHRPGPRATIIPDEALETYHDITQFSAALPTPVATVHFAGSPVGKYKTAWKFKKSLPTGANENALALRYTGDPHVATNWEVYVNGAKISAKVTWTDHSASGVHIPGTARWAWLDSDEAIWVRCAEGCCLVEVET